MAEAKTENLLDFNSKKKKKVKLPHLQTMQSASLEAEPEAPIADVPDFGSKKKKKKTVKIDEVTTSTTPESLPASVEITTEVVTELAEKLYDELGFTQKKKKKAKALDEEKKPLPTDSEQPQANVGIVTNEANIPSIAPTVVQSGDMPAYTYEMLLNRVFSQLKANKPELMNDQKRRLIMAPPMMARVGSKKTLFTNFTVISRSLSRPAQHLSAYLLAELGTTGSVDQNGGLLIRGKYLSKHIEPVLRNYCRTYVLCNTCQSPDTSLCKDARLYFLQCERCGSRITVKNVTSGFQAVVGKRSAVRAKAQ